MIQFFEATRVRAFEHLAINGLRPVNIIVGRSAAGKTALLEGIRMALGATPKGRPYPERYAWRRYAHPAHDA
jgi:AAA15 family ATPase/GTPase